MTARTTYEEKKHIAINLANVGEFWYAFELPLAMTWQDSSSDARTLSANLIAEEFKELLDAENKVERLDALCDLLYVSLGGVLGCGFRMDLFDKAGVAVPLQVAVSRAHVDLLKADPCWTSIPTSIANCVTTVIRTGHAMFGLVNFEMAFAAVHDNNMKKLWEKAPEGEGEGEGEGIVVKKKILPSSGAIRWLVKRASDGKVVKPPNHVKVDLSIFVRPAVAT